MPLENRLRRPLLLTALLLALLATSCSEKAAKRAQPRTDGPPSPQTTNGQKRKTPKRPSLTTTIVPEDAIAATGRRPTNPELLTLGTSRYVIAWRDEPRLGSSAIFLRLGQIGIARLGKPQRVTPDDGRIHRDMRLERLGDERFIVIWWAYRSKPSGDTEREALVREFDVDGTPHPIKRLPTPKDALSLPHLVRFPSGKWIAIWSAKGKKAYHLFASPLHKEQQRHVLDPSKLYHNFFHPLSVALDDERAMVIWWASVGKTGALRARIVNDEGRPIGAPFYVTLQLQHRVFNPTVTKLDNGNVVASWDLHTQRRVKSEVMARVFSNRGRPLGPAFLVNTYRKGNQVRPSVAALPNGAFAISWQSDGQDGDGAGVYLQRFRANGKHEGGETRVALMIEGDQLAPRIAGFGTNHLLLLWTHRDLEGRRLAMRVLEPFRFPL